MGQSTRMAQLKKPLPESEVRTLSCTLWHAPEIPTVQGTEAGRSQFKACLGNRVSSILALAI